MAGDPSLEEPLALFKSANPDESRLGMSTLFRRFVNRTETWDAFVKHIEDTSASEISPVLVHYLAHIPWHPDIPWTGDEPIKQETSRLRPAAD